MFLIEAELETTLSLANASVDINLETDLSNPHRRLHDAANYVVSESGPLSLLRVTTAIPESIVIQPGIGERWPMIWATRVDSVGTMGAIREHRFVGFHPKRCDPGPGCVGSAFIAFDAADGLIKVSVEQSLHVLDDPLPAEAAELSVVIGPPTKWVDMGTVHVPAADDVRDASSEVLISFRLSATRPEITVIPVLTIEGMIPTHFSIDPSLKAAQLLSSSPSPREAHLYLALFGAEFLPEDFKVYVGEPRFQTCDDPEGC